MMPTLCPSQGPREPAGGTAGWWELRAPYHTTWDQPSRCNPEGFMEEEMLKALSSWSSPGRPGSQLSKVDLC